MKVFVSFDAVDAVQAERVIRELRDRGYEIITGTDIPEGDNWKSEVGNRVRDADSVVVLLSEHSTRSEIVQITAAAIEAESRNANAIGLGSIDPDLIPKVLASSKVIAYPAAAASESFFSELADAVALPIEGPSQLPPDASTREEEEQKKGEVLVDSKLALTVITVENLVGQQVELSEAIAQERERFERIGSATQRVATIRELLLREAVWKIVAILPVVGVGVALVSDHTFLVKAWAWLAKTFGLVQGGATTVPGHIPNPTEEDPSASAEGDYVHFSLFARSNVDLAAPLTIRVFLYNLADFPSVLKRAEELDPKALEQDRDKSSEYVARDTELSLTLYSPDLICERPTRHVVWSGDTTPVKFRVEIPSDKKEQQTWTGYVLVTRTGIPIARLDFDLQREAGTCRYYRSAFVSYANKDIRRIHQLLEWWIHTGQGFFLDKYMKKGRKWRPEIQSAIESCDCFVLCWSHSCRRSKFCKKEFHHFDDRRTQAEESGIKDQQLPDLYPNELEREEPYPELWEGLKKYQFRFIASKADSDGDKESSDDDETLNSAEGYERESVSVRQLQKYVDENGSGPEQGEIWGILDGLGWHKLAIGPQKLRRYSWVRNGGGFQDDDWSPEMVIVRPGSFKRGAEYAEGESIHEQPVREIIIPNALGIGKFPVTAGEWAAFLHDRNGGAEERTIDDKRIPIVNVTWHDAQDYVEWLSKKTGRRYRLLSEAEWEYACRAGTTTPFWTGQRINRRQANYDGRKTYKGSPLGTRLGRLTTVDTFRANPFGLHDMHGNVWEWVEDDYQDTYYSAPTDGTAPAGAYKKTGVTRGGSYRDPPSLLRSAARAACAKHFASDSLGLRVARELDFAIRQAQR